MENTLTDRERICYLRGMAPGIGHTDGTPFDEATFTFHGVRPQSFDIISMKEIKPMIDFYAKLPTMVDMGHQISPPEKFVYWMLKDAGLIDAFAELAEYEAKIAANPKILEKARARRAEHGRGC